MPLALAWFRRDLRLHDNPALVAACAAGAVLPVFVLDPALAEGPRASANRTWFLVESLRVLAAELASRGARLLVLAGRPAEVIPALVREAGATDVFASRDVSPYARTRDRAVGNAIEALGAGLHLLRGQQIVEPDAISTGAGGPFAIFTPYLRRWQAAPRRSFLPAPAAIPGAAPRHARGLDLANPGALPTAFRVTPTAETVLLPTPGEAAARARLAAWAASPGPDAYADRRNLLAVEGTSRLSADLTFGLLSPQEVLDATAGPGDGRRTFEAELAWRDFYAQVLWHHPHVVRGAYRPALDALPWRDDPAALDAWRDGRTGYPVVDAAQRQLRAAGWMHNRARMISASFLAKDLLLDWRAGEDHFMRHLVDGDLAANNGGWQWSAGTGTDAQPFVRIFNPVLQGMRFDPDGAYVRRWVPELRDVPAAHLHQPWTMPPDVQVAAGCRIGRDYPAPIVDHGAARQRALAAWASTRTREEA